ncbi:FecCD family ABC transporter permease [Kocuria coralli]|uniref:FecCD family ABC transporter permease n=1 Tax=Kocuria coralli TaxID=1461025 RepID=UPI001FE582F8|nr:iron ABC transporter permease [Kocuria coralli]
MSLTSSREHVVEDRHREAPRRRRGVAAGVFLLGAGIVVLLFFLSLAIGSKPLSFPDVWHGLTTMDGSRESIIVWQLRMPRTVLAVLVGAALAVAGVMMQALTRNPLAEPGLLGVNSGAAFVVVLSITVLGATGIGTNLWFAFLGSALAAGFVYGISIRRTHASDHARLVLAGAALTACLGSLTGIMTMFNTEVFSSYRFWVIGSVAERGTEPLVAITPFVLVGLVLALACGPMLNALALGDEQATSLGVRLAVIRGLAFASITLLCGAATAAAGPIAFVGLVVPHALRLVVGVEQRVLLSLSLIAGPALVLAADIIGRIVAPPGELEVGLVTAFIGAPVLLALIMRRRSS